MLHNKELLTAQYNIFNLVAQSEDFLRHSKHGEQEMAHYEWFLGTVPDWHRQIWLPAQYDDGM